MTCIMERDGRPAWQEGGAVERGGGENPGGTGGCSAPRPQRLDLARPAGAVRKDHL